MASRADWKQKLNHFLSQKPSKLSDLASNIYFTTLLHFLQTNILLFQVDLRHMCEVEGSNVVDLGIDLSEFYMSVEWDILEVPAVRWDNIVYTRAAKDPSIFTITITEKAPTPY